MDIVAAIPALAAVSSTALSLYFSGRKMRMPAIGSAVVAVACLGAYIGLTITGSPDMALAAAPVDATAFQGRVIEWTAQPTPIDWSSIAHTAHSAAAHATATPNTVQVFAPAAATSTPDAPLTPNPYWQKMIDNINEVPEVDPAPLQHFGAMIWNGLLFIKDIVVK